jgi:hypothetical protein
MVEETKAKSKEEEEATSQDVEEGPTHKYTDDHKLTRLVENGQRPKEVPEVPFAVFPYSFNVHLLHEIILLNSTIRGESEVEALAKRIEERRGGRVVITFDVRVALVQGCRQIAVDKGYPISKIDIADLLEFRDETKRLFEEQKKTPIYRMKKLLNFRVQSEQLLEVLDRAVPLVQDDQDDHDNWFHYMDCKFAFSFPVIIQFFLMFCFLTINDDLFLLFAVNIYYTKVESKWPWMRNGVTVALMVLFLFYFATPIFFCNIVKDSGVCPSEPGKPYSGWMSALYFASTTLSTVRLWNLNVLCPSTCC